MIDLRFPLKNQLQDPVDEAALHRIAHRIDSHASRSNHRRLLPLVLGGVTAVGLVIACRAMGIGGQSPAPPASTLTIALQS